MKAGLMDAMEARPSLMIVIGGGSSGPRPNTIEKPEPMKPIPGEEEEEDDEETEDNPEEDDEDGSATPEERDNKRIVVEAMQALQGKHDNPDFATNEYIATYGQKDFDDLKKMITGKTEPQRAAEGRLIEGPGSGLDDRVRARVGNQPVLLSDGEYVIPADVVSHLGNGSTQGGVRVIEAMMDRVRRARTGTVRQASGLDLHHVLPR